MAFILRIFHLFHIQKLIYFTYQQEQEEKSYIKTENVFGKIQHLFIKKKTLSKLLIEGNYLKG